MYVLSSLTRPIQFSQEDQYKDANCIISTTALAPVERPLFGDIWSSSLGASVDFMPVLKLDVLVSPGRELRNAEV